ncbi:MAG TPA: hypothetical protein VFD15_00895 [Clostridia bacterium]|nr:hypothetical protein [Clostridia bacterium]
MYSGENALIQDVKREVLAELRQVNSTGGSHPYNPYTGDQMYQSIKDSVKKDVLAEFEAQQMDRVAEMYGLNRSLSDRKLQRMIDDRYRDVERMKQDIKKELLTLQKEGRASDPHIRQTAGILAEEGQRRGVPFGQLVAGLDKKTASGTGVMDKISEMLNTGQRRGFLYGLGSAVLCHLLIPSLRGNMRSIAVRSVEEGMSMVDRAKSFVSGQQQQCQPPNFASYDPESPPLNNPPPSGDNLS